MNLPYQKIVHVLIILIGITFLALGKEPSEALMFFGLALAFDPFDPKQPWKERPVWQRTILLAELFMVILLFIGMIWPSLYHGFV